MNKKIRMSIALVMIAVLLFSSVLAVSGAYDTVNDPIVVYSGLLKWAEETFRPSIVATISEKISPLQTTIAGYESKIANLEKQVADLSAKLGEQDEPTDQPAATANGYEVIYVTAGTKMLATSVCSIILRSGTAEAVSPFTEGIVQGLNNVTDGSELLNGDAIPRNHHLLIPRGNDGRGIHVTSPDGAYILVQGGYTLVEP